MNPVLIAALVAAGASALKNAGALAPDELERQNKARLEELKRREEMGALGLTDQEQAALERRLRQGSERVQEQAQFERERLLAGTGGAVAGQALQQAAAAEDKLMRLQTEVAGRVQEADLAEKEKEEDELRALEAAVAERKRERRDALGEVGATTLQAGFGASQQQAIVQGQKDISDEQLRALQSQTGMSEEEARGLYELALTNPEIFKYMMSLSEGGE